MAADYIKHIAHTDAEKTGVAWCGHKIGMEFTFVNIDHAAYNAMNGGRLVACEDCVKAVIKALTEES